MRGLSPEPRPLVAGCLTERIPPRWPFWMYKTDPDKAADVKNDIHCVYSFLYAGIGKNDLQAPQDKDKDVTASDGNSAIPEVAFYT